MLTNIINSIKYINNLTIFKNVANSYFFHISLVYQKWKRVRIQKEGEKPCPQANMK